jgi:serine/threonine protein kinase
MSVVHGDLKAVRTNSSFRVHGIDIGCLQLNILVKDDGSACLADFGLMSIVLGPETADITTSTDGGTKGTYRWMSPELFYPDDFGLSKFQLTKESDCYAFGMVIYEVGGSQNRVQSVLWVSFMWRRFLQGRSLSKKLKWCGKCLLRCTKEPAQPSHKVSLREWRNFGTPHNSVGGRNLRIGRPSWQSWKSSAPSLVKRMSLLSHYASPGR